MVAHGATAAKMPIDETTRNKASLAFDSDRLDALLDEVGIDVVIASSKHNIHYLLGGYTSSSSTRRTRRD